MAARNKRLLADDAIIVLSDEQSASDDEETKDMLIGADEPNGPANVSESPGEMDLSGGGATQLMDFRDISSESLFGKRREVYRL